MESYQLPTPEDWTKTNLKSLEFIRARADERLANTVDYFNRLYERIFRYLGIVTPTTAVVLAYLYGEVITPGESIPPGAWPGFLALLGVCMYCIYRLSRVQLPHQVYNPGQRPQEIALGQYLGVQEGETPLSEDDQYRALLMGHIESRQMGIVRNEATCAYLQSVLSSVLRVILVTFILGATVVVAFAGWAAWA